MSRSLANLLRDLGCPPLFHAKKTPKGYVGGLESRNIVVLGSLGVGKSSFINMLIGKPVAQVSSSVSVAHPPVAEYITHLNDILHKSSLSSESNPTLRFYDTLGLEHRPSPLAVVKARLKHSGGAHLVVYCMRRGRLSKEQVSHLDMIWKTICQEGDVPLVLVIGDIGYHHGSPEEWWEVNGKDLENAARVRFDNHICLNTWDPTHPSWDHQGVSYDETQKLARDLVIRNCKSLYT